MQKAASFRHGFVSKPPPGRGLRALEDSMKKVLSISLGSSTRDHTTEVEFLGERIWISRQGANGDFAKALQRKRNLHILLTTTPRLGGRSFGANVMEAVCRCLIDKPDDQITDADIVDLIERIPLKPQVHVLNPA